MLNSIDIKKDDKLCPYISSVVMAQVPSNIVNNQIKGNNALTIAPVPCLKESCELYVKGICIFKGIFKTLISIKTIMENQDAKKEKGPD